MSIMTLEEIVEKARKHVTTPAERRAQRVSLITGVLSQNTTLTKDKVSSLLDEIEGHVSEPEKRTA